MSLTVENGTGLETANSYVSVEYVNTYHSDRGNNLWAGSDAKKEQAIIRATDYIEKRFATRFRGTKQSRRQALSWPRFNAIDNSGFLFSEEDNIPRKLKMAVAEYALRALKQGELAPDPGLPVAGQSNDTDIVAPAQNLQSRVTSVSKKVGPIQTTTQYQPAPDYSADVILPAYPAADMLLREMLISPRSGKLVRG